MNLHSQQQPSEIFSETLATLVLYNTSLENSITFKSLTRALESTDITMDILVYDNSAQAHLMPTSMRWNIHYVHDPNNPGVSKAYNEGLKFAKQLGKKWLWLFDQDTAYSTHVVSEFSLSINKNPDQKIFVPQLHDEKGLVSPFKFTNGGGKRIDIQPGDHTLLDFVFHNCGLLVSTHIFEKAGGYDERFSLDFSDISFAKGLAKVASTFVLTSASAHHKLASTSTASTIERARRFNSYVSACRAYKKHYEQNNILLSVRLFLRAVKLCWQHKSFQFLEIYLKS